MLKSHERFIFFALGRCQFEAKKRFEGKPLSVSMSKAAFIELARAAGMVAKSPRAVYRNLEELEKRKYVDYQTRSLILTERGQKAYEKILTELLPYFTVAQIASNDVLKFTSKVK